MRKTRRNKSQAIELIIFDCDGVLVDSEVISCRAHAETLSRHGYPISPDQVLKRFLGVSDREARLTIEGELGCKLPDDFETEMKQAALRLYEEHLHRIPHVAETVTALSLPKCVASSGTPEKIRHGLTCAGLYEALAPHLFSAVQVKRGKPAPDLFLFAAEQMKASPERCIVVEDSIAGVTGARSAGMTVLGFHGGSHCLEGYATRVRAAGAHETFDDMRQLPALIARNQAKIAIN